ncbi:MAG TPA: hypothetical protein VNU01_03025 [Egibacteraceae bacterium]|nr:hypothetical protein [Egibacteraceae bacterium]
MNALLRATERVPNWFRAAAMVVLPFLAYWAATRKAPLPSAVFVGWSLVTLLVHLPVMFFDGPLPVSELGVHHSGEIHPWEDVVAVEPLGEKDLRAVLADGRTVKLRVRGGRTRADMLAAIAAYRPELAKG